MISPIALTPGEVAVYYNSRVPNLRLRNARDWRGPCPIHHGDSDNFSVDPDTGRWFCHSQCGRGGDVLELEEALAGGTFPSRKAEVFRLVGRSSESTHSAKRGRFVCAYSYTDEKGDELYQVVRYAEPKSFAQRYPDEHGNWVWRKHPRQVLYHLREVLEAPIVFLVEGEKDVETLRSWGFIATTNAGGASAAWLHTFTETLAGREVIIIPDSDAPGRARAKKIARALFGHVARLWRIDLSPIKDVTEWFEAGHSEIELLAVLEGVNAF